MSLCSPLGLNLLLFRDGVEMDVIVSRSVMVRIGFGWFRGLGEDHVDVEVGGAEARVMPGVGGVGVRGGGGRVRFPCLLGLRLKVTVKSGLLRGFRGKELGGGLVWANDSVSNYVIPLHRLRCDQKKKKFEF